MVNWIDDHFGIFWAMVIAAILGLCWIASQHDEKVIASRCDSIMSFAESRHDSMEASIACARIKADHDRDMAISVAVGAAAGAAAAAAGSRSR